MELKNGARLQGGKYRIERMLGHGSFGITYVATGEFSSTGNLGQMKFTHKVAIKEFFMGDINRRGADGTSVEGSAGNVFVNYRRKFRKEAENLAKLNHPNIVKVYDIFDENDTTYYVMELIEGISLDDYISNRGRLPEDEALRITGEIARALEYMHSRRMLHLDVKPKNVMYRTDSRNILIDFGLSKQYSDGGEPESSTTIGMGTPGYAPLEQSQHGRAGAGGTFPATLDVYALGATLYKMLTGQRPPDATVILDEGFPKDTLRRFGISAQTIDAVSRAMSVSKRDRQQSITEFIDSLPVGVPKVEADEKTTIDDEDRRKEEDERLRREEQERRRNADEERRFRVEERRRKEEGERRNLEKEDRGNLVSEFIYGIRHRNPLTTAALFAGLLLSVGWTLYVWMAIPWDYLSNVGYWDVINVLRTSMGICFTLGILRLLFNQGNGKYLPAIYGLFIFFFIPAITPIIYPQLLFLIIGYVLVVLTLYLPCDDGNGFSVLRKTRMSVGESIRIWKNRNMFVNVALSLGLLLCLTCGLYTVYYQLKWAWLENGFEIGRWFTIIQILAWTIGMIYVVAGYRLGCWIFWFGSIVFFSICIVWSSMFSLVVLDIFPVALLQGLLCIPKKGKMAWSVMR